MKRSISFLSLLLCAVILIVSVSAGEYGLLSESVESDPGDPPVTSEAHSITVKGGAASIDGESVTEATAGEIVTLTAGNSTTGREFYRWIDDSLLRVEFDDPSSTVTSFVMPDRDVELRAAFILPGTVMPVEEYVARLVEVAEKYKTLYVMGCFGAPLNETNKVRYINHHSFNADPERAAMINAADEDTFGFDCVCLLKGVLWGWHGDLDHVYGGARYASNGVPDVSADGMFGLCKDPSTDFEEIEFGEAVWMAGHIGLYIGDGLAVECTPKWDNGVQITACNRTIEGYYRRNWSKHGKLPYVDYAADSEAQAPDVPEYEVRFVSSEHPEGLESGFFRLGSNVVFPELSVQDKVLVAWYTDEELTSKFDPSTSVTGEFTLYAKWRGVDDPVDPDEDTPEPPEDLYEIGDVNLDEKINAKDVIILMKSLIGAPPESFTYEKADVNGDGKVNAKDVVVLMRKIIEGDVQAEEADAQSAVEEGPD